MDALGEPVFDYERWEVHRSNDRYGRLVLGILFGKTTQRIFPVVLAVGLFSSVVFVYNNVSPAPSLSLSPRLSLRPSLSPSLRPSLSPTPSPSLSPSLSLSLSLTPPCTIYGRSSSPRRRASPSTPSAPSMLRAGLAESGAQPERAPEREPEREPERCWLSFWLPRARTAGSRSGCAPSWLCHSSLP